MLKDRNQAPEDPLPVDLDLEKVLGDMPRKTYNFKRSHVQLSAHQLPEGAHQLIICCIVVFLCILFAAKYETGEPSAAGFISAMQQKLSFEEILHEHCPVFPEALQVSACV